MSVATAKPRTGSCIVISVGDPQKGDKLLAAIRKRSRELQELLLEYAEGVEHDGYARSEESGSEESGSEEELIRAARAGDWALDQVLCVLCSYS